MWVSEIYLYIFGNYLNFRVLSLFNIYVKTRSSIENSMISDLRIKSLSFGLNYNL